MRKRQRKKYQEIEFRWSLYVYKAQPAHLGQICTYVRFRALFFQLKKQIVAMIKRKLKHWKRQEIPARKPKASAFASAFFLL